MEFAIRTKMKEALPYRCWLLTFGTEERGGLELVKLLALILPSSHGVDFSFNESRAAGMSCLIGQRPFCLLRVDYFRTPAIRTMAFMPGKRGTRRC